VLANNIGVPNVSLTVSFAQLDQTEEYKHLSLLERVSLFDTVNVEFPALKVSATAKAVKMVYDCLADRVKSVTLGSVRANIADTVANQENKIVETAKQEANRAVKGQTSEDIFNRLTDNGRIQGMYIEGDRWYINAEIAKLVNLVADAVKSVRGDSQLDINGSELSILSKKFGQTFAVTNWEDGAAYMYMTQYDSSGKEIGQSQFGANRVQIGGSWANPIFGIYSNQDGTVRIRIGDKTKTISWKDNNDGTYTIVGE
jgi:hypothetical protein